MSDIAGEDLDDILDVIESLKRRMDVLERHVQKLTQKCDDEGLLDDWGDDFEN